MANANLRLFTMLTAVSLFPAGALAQRANENALLASGDAFGTSVGNESTGLYTTTSARGFSPVAAGNVRIEGMYFDPGPAGMPSGRIVRGSTVRVGIAAQSYAFPAPTGIVDVQLRLPANEAILSTTATYGPYDSRNIQIDAQTPIVSDKLGLVAGGDIGYNTSDNGGHIPQYSLASLLQWTPTDNLRVTPFFSFSRLYNWRNGPLLYVPGEPPLKFDRKSYFTQPWAKRDQRNFSFGSLATFVPAADWAVRAGIFRTYTDEPRTILPVHTNVQPDGSANYSLQAEPPRESGSTSGEVRASRVFGSEDVRHALHIAARGRTASRQFGGGDFKSFGAANILARFAVPSQTFTFGPLSTDKVQQGTAGLSYQLGWGKLIEASVGLQKATYKRTVQAPNRPASTNTASPWLYNGTLAVNVASNVTAFGSYTRGLEESGIAPERALNRGEPQTASITEQMDAGVRYAIVPGITLVGSVFQISKPFFDVDPTGTYRRIGDLRHRGIEASVSGKLTDDLTVLVGALFLEARISGELVNRGLIGDIPIGTAPNTITANIQYAPPEWNGFSVDAQLGYTSLHYGNALNTLVMPSRSTIDIGGRYQFKLPGVVGSVRARIYNLTNIDPWRVDAGGRWWPHGTRRASVTVSLDL